MQDDVKAPAGMSAGVWDVRCDRSSLRVSPKLLAPFPPTKWDTPIGQLQTRSLDENVIPMPHAPMDSRPASEHVVISGDCKHASCARIRMNAERSGGDVPQRSRPPGRR